MTDSPDPRTILGVSLEADDEEIRTAYLRKIKEFPPDRSPAEFERVRDAYALLRDPRKRIEWMLLSAEADESLVNLLNMRPAARNFVGPEVWLEAMRKR